MRVKPIEAALMFGLALSPAAAPSVAAQNDSGHRAQAGGAMAKTDEVFDLDFPGGTAVEFIEAVRQARPNANIIVTDVSELESVRIPAVKLRDIALSTVMAYLDEQGSEEIRMGVRSFHESARGEAVYEVWTHVPSTRERGRDTPDEFAVWSVREHLDAGMSTEDLLSAVQLVASVVETEIKPELKFHEGAALVIFRGTHSKQLDLVQQALERMKGDAQRIAERRRERREQIEHLKDQLISYRQMIDQQEAELEAAKEALSLNRRALEDYKASRQGDLKAINPRYKSLVETITKAETEVAKAQARMRTHKARIAQLEEKLKRLRDAGTGSATKPGG